MEELGIPGLPSPGKTDPFGGYTNSAFDPLDPFDPYGEFPRPLEAVESLQTASPGYWRGHLGHTDRQGAVMPEGYHDAEMRGIEPTSPAARPPGPNDATARPFTGYEAVEPNYYSELMKLPGGDDNK